MLSIAPIKYAQVMSEDGGPIERLEYAEVEVAGAPCNQAVSYLSADLVSEGSRSDFVTKQPDGAGSHKSVQIACHMAISEAIERWALIHCRANPGEIECGIEHDGSSNGFAAFPGLFRRQARKAAFRESIERHCLICWWEGLLSHRPLPDPRPGIRAIEINNPFSSHTVVVIWGMHGEQHSYAFGAGESVNTAVWRALVEMGRIKRLLDQLVAYVEDPSKTAPITDLFERRILFFSTESGMRLFLDRLMEPVVQSPKPLRLLFDGPVNGPWDRYASVWRTVIDAPSKTYLSDREDYFFW